MTQLSLKKTYYLTFVAQNQSMKMCQIITGSDDAVPLTQHKMIFTGCTAARKPLQSDFVLTLKHHMKSIGLFILLHASEAFRSDRSSSSLASLTVKNGSLPSTSWIYDSWKNLYPVVNVSFTGRFSLTIFSMKALVNDGVSTRLQCQTSEKSKKYSKTRPAIFF